MKFERYERVYHEKNLPSVPDSQLIGTTLQRPVILSSGFVLFSGCTARHVALSFPDQGLNSCPLCWKLFICTEAVPKYISFPTCF